MSEKMTSIRTKCIIALLAAMMVITLTNCEDESDMAINKIASPVLMTVTNVPGAVTAKFFELDKSGILDHTVGIDSIPLANLDVEVFASKTPVGVFSTDSDGSVTINYSDARPNEFAGQYKGIAFRFLK